MKKVLCICLLLGLLGNIPALALSADENAMIGDMTLSWYQGYTPEIIDDVMTLCLPLQAEGWTGDISVSIALDDPYVFLLADIPETVTVTPVDGIYPVQLRLPLQKDRRNGDYPATITVRGEAGVVTLPHVIRIRDGLDSHEALQPVISDLTGVLEVGSQGSLTVTLENPTSTLSMLGGVLRVTDLSGDILPVGSQLVRVPELLPRSSVTLTIPVFVDASAALRLHTLELQLDYRVLGEAKSWTEPFTLPVTQAIRLEQGGVQLPTTVAGEQAGLTLPLMNMGKGALENVLVTLEIEGVVAAQSVLVGTVGPGQTAQARLSFTPKPEAAGAYTGQVRISCEDAYGNSFSQILDVTVQVDAPLPEASEPVADEPKAESGLTIFLVAAGLLLAAALVVQGVLLKNKLHKLEEERL